MLSLDIGVLHCKASFSAHMKIIANKWQLVIVLFHSNLYHKIGLFSPDIAISLWMSVLSCSILAVKLKDS